MKCLVTGATGFVGKPLCLAMVAKGYQVSSLQRGIVSIPGVESIYCDLSKTAIDSVDLKGVDVVIHLAGIAHQQADREAFEQVNYRATVALAEQASRCGVKHFVFIGSVKAMGVYTGQAARVEDNLRPCTDAYGRSKRHAEEALEQFAKRDGMSISCLRPALVYGVGVKANLDSFVRASLKGLPRPAKGGARSMVALPDLVEAILLLVEQGVDQDAEWKSDGNYRCFIACDNELYDLQRVHDAVRQSVGLPIVQYTLPLWLCRLACICRDVLSSGGGDESSYDKLFGTALFSSAALQQAVGWAPKETIETLMPSIIKSIEMDKQC